MKNEVKFIVLILALISIIIFYIFSQIKAPKKEYKIEVIQSYTIGNNTYNHYFYADSVKKATVWKDNQYLIIDNMINIRFK